MYQVSELPETLQAVGVQIPPSISLQWEVLVRQEIFSRQQTSDTGIQRRHVLAEPSRASATSSSQVPAAPKRKALAVGLVAELPHPKRIAISLPSGPSTAANSNAALAVAEDQWLSNAGAKRLCSMSLPERNDIIANLSHDSLVRFAQDELVRRDKDVQKEQRLKHSIAMKNQQLRRVHKKNEQLQTQLLEKKMATGDSLKVVRHSGGHKLTWKGNVVLGLRKSMALVFASAFPLASLVETSRWTVTRAELNAWAHVMSRTRRGKLEGGRGGEGRRTLKA